MPEDLKRSEDGKEKWLKHLNDRGAETSRHLMEADIAPPVPIVDRLIYAGALTIIAGSPKAGKSVVTTQMAIAVADGGKFLDEFQAKAGHVLWYDVDDGDRYRTQKRLENLGQDLENENIVIHRKLPSIPDGAIKQIEADLDAEKSAGRHVAFILIDCLLAILGCGPIKSIVQDQRRQMEELRGLAIKHELAVVVIHHSMKKPPKRKDGFAVFDAMLGTTGISTVVDVGIVLEDTTRDGEVVARFASRNPDTPSDLAMKLDREGLTGWHVTAGVEEARKGRDLGRVARAILDVLESVAPLTPTGIVATAREAGTELTLSSVKVNCWRMAQRGLLRGENGSYQKVRETAVTGVTAETFETGVTAVTAETAGESWEWLQAQADDSGTGKNMPDYSDSVFNALEAFGGVSPIPQRFDPYDQARAA
ncbi:MAG: AAA family ATPase [Bryobacteraceae bacterium]|jgi:hypothetical protein